MQQVLGGFAKLATRRTAIVSRRISFVGFAVYHNAGFLVTPFPPPGKSELSATSYGEELAFRRAAFVSSKI